MKLLSELLADDPATPRLSVYDETIGTRLDFSATTLDNWAAKVANMLLDELDLEPGAKIAVALPPGWQSTVIVLGALAANIDYSFDPAHAAVLFTDISRIAAGEFSDFEGDICALSDDPLGRGVEELGLELPTGIIDFAPTVRFYGDAFTTDERLLRECVATTFQPKSRVLGTGWTSMSDFEHQVLQPLAVGGSSVIVRGLADTQRLAEIATVEKVTELV
ncbi:TIGR03089 family protein [Corynebacterium sp. sy017]|uniref:TIGR03089 family protein n=1 Tax=unclassified Corynebacterium TaxID=2624378 RepID=UPI001185B1EE|nr:MULTISPECIES: TIGR03089 family protein [unclassified Corynebacterium]MBP3088717.1 TIGR03089 family protein [Corynebacterium sp. sy017]TSD92002.1 TIGR03089 family protein [Corynebacterium sp. SY003]